MKRDGRLNKNTLRGYRVTKATTIVMDQANRAGTRHTAARYSNPQNQWDSRSGHDRSCGSIGPKDGYWRVMGTGEGMKSLLSVII